MSVAEARRVIGTWKYREPSRIAKPLEFGNERQIEAVRVLEELERRREVGDYECQTCEGTGNVECPECGSDEKECEDCEGTGITMEGFGDEEDLPDEGNQGLLF